MSYLVLVRHGESRWNTRNRFTGWVDVPLSQNGMKEAMNIASGMKKLKLDVAYTSHLERAHMTLLTILAEQHRTGIFIHDHSHGGFEYAFKNGSDELPIYPTWLLNERHYGVLQGMDKHQAAKKFGLQKVLEWRRGFHARPPHGESLEDVYLRAVPYFERVIMPEIRKPKNVLIVAHGNALRAIIKHLENISDDRIAQLELKPGQPFVYSFERGALKKTFRGHTFDRPLDWE